MSVGGVFHTPAARTRKACAGAPRWLSANAAFVGVANDARQMTPQDLEQNRGRALETPYGRIRLQIINRALWALLYMYLLNRIFFFGDVSEPWQLSFQDSATKIMEGIINLHNWILFYLIVITIFVLWFLIVTIKEFNVTKHPISNKNLKDGTLIEVIWTLTPALILITIALPSFKLLYLMDEVLDPTITIKAVGRQWYWEYEYSDYNSPEINFESYMIPTDDLQEGQLRLLEVDNRLILPSQTSIRVIVTAADVLHSWAVPALGVKMDCIPGRLNQTSLYVKRNGVYYGQCSELCGVQHGFMPIVIEVVNINDYIAWLKAYEAA